MAQPASLRGALTRSVETHRRNFLSKLDAKNTVDAIIIAFRLGLFDFLE